MAATGSRKFQAPKGTRDFYPQDMAVRRYIEGVWRQTSINHGFDEVEGPTFEDIELYTHKSGPGIASEIFQVFSGKDEKEIAAMKAGGTAPFALRPEFTPTLARMVAAKAAELPRPIKWFAIPSHFRAERPQRGRLREFMQWNVDFIGDESPKADAEVIATAVAALERFGLTPDIAKVFISDRTAVTNYLLSQGIGAERHPQVLEFLDKSSKLPSSEFVKQAEAIGLKPHAVLPFAGRALLDVEIARGSNAVVADVLLTGLSIHSQSEALAKMFAHLEQAGIPDWCDVDISIVRGLAYYTGTVFEIHETTGAERAIAGGGRYDNLIESFGGPSLPACGFGMGDVVLGNILHDKGLLPEEVYMKPLRPHAFAVVAADEAEGKMRQTVAGLRRNGFHVRHSYKTTRNVGKLLGDASKSRAMSAIIFGKDVAADPPRVEFKDLQSGEQVTISLTELEGKLKEIIARND